MPYQVTARKWRPRRFEEVVAQEHVTTTLSNAVLTGRVAQCYLFSGPRGVGKTTTARILAKVLNCVDPRGADPCDACPSCVSIAAGTSMNVLEIDGASNNSVDDIRELREAVRYLPTEGKRKVYIIDEVHMLSQGAFNALLKTLEEPPAHVVFIFATTEAQKVPDTILSRSQRFNFRRIPNDRIAAHLRVIADTEQIRADDEALFLLAARADGALRDAESLLDQVVAYDPEKVSAEGVRKVLGLVDGGTYFKLSEAVAHAEPGKILTLLGEVVDSGVDIEEFVHGFVVHMRNLMFTRTQGSASALDISQVERRRYEESAGAFQLADLVRMLHDLLELEAGMRHGVQPRFRVEMTLVRLAVMARTAPLGELLRRMKHLEDRLRREGGGSGVASDRARPKRSPSGEGSAGGKEGAGGRQDRERDREPAPEGGGAAAERKESPPPAQTTLESIQSQWGALVQDVRRVQPALAMFLHDARPVGMDGNVVKLEFARADRFQLTQVERGRSAIEQSMEKRWGSRLRLLCVAGEEAHPEDGGKDTTGTDPRVRTVLEILDGELI